MNRALAACVVSIWLSVQPSHAQVVNPTVDPVSAMTGVGTGLNYTTGFEPEEGFAPGYIGNSNQPAGCGGISNPCWGTTQAADRSLVEGHIDTLHPHSGAQHLRLSHDKTTRTNRPNFNLGIDARFPQTSDLVAQPVAPSTISLQISIDSRYGQSFRIQPQSNSQGLLMTSVLFLYDGSVYVLNGCGKEVEWRLEYVWQSEAYHLLRFMMNPCEDEISIFYRLGIIANTCMPFGTSLEQLLVFGDNYPGSSMDVDSIVLESGNPCPVFGACCDNNGFQVGCVDGQVEADCTGLDKVWSANTLCNDIECVCVPDCENRECGFDGCGGSCGNCSDGDQCNGIESCDEGQCVPGMAPDCHDELYCNGLESCSPFVGCVPGTPPCAEDEVCDEEQDTCRPYPIPAISDWGLVVLALVLLVAAKVQFRRRPA